MKKNNMNWTVKLITLATICGLMATPVCADPKFTVEGEGPTDHLGSSQTIIAVDKYQRVIFTIMF